ncbi:MAG: Crp/Fnr family transcriptional regulator [Bacteroidetes bacterium]|nr:Crp/Fnr family transcriptional regulator [Bacteroidota bacterium]MBS1633128.1 Crp/Fnr family transcriptional regulator [Bacteroidota bacterium]
MIDIDTLLAWGATYKKVNKEEIIFNEGVECIFYYQLVSGSIRWVNIKEDGREFIQAIIEPGECFGELPLFDSSLYAANAIANCDSVLLRLNKTTFRQLLREYPDLHFSFSKLISARLRFKFLLLKELACNDPEQRIVALLSYLKTNRKNICHDCNRVNLTRQQIANMTGLRVETVIRTIKSLQQKGTLFIDKGKVYC